MSKGRGKGFEREVRDALTAHGGLVHRNVDAMIGKGHVSVASKPDLTCWWINGASVLLECKAVKGKSLPFSRIGDHQARDLLAFEQHAERMHAGLVVNFYDGKRGPRRLHRAFYLPIGVVVDLEVQLQPRKSIPLSACERHAIEWSWLPGQGWQIPDTMEGRQWV